MTDANAETVLDLVGATKGHFLLESGYHSRLWLDLDSLFVDPARVLPLVKQLAVSLRWYDVEGICGPLLGGAFLAQTLASILETQFFFTERVMPRDGRGLYRTSYRLPAAIRDRMAGKRVAIVDDVNSAGSAVRGTFAELLTQNCHPVVIGSLLALGTQAESFFQEQGLAVLSVTRHSFELWLPAECPLCAERVPLEDRVGFAQQESSS